MRKLEIYISNCKDREEKLQKEELPTIKNVVLLINSYDAIAFYLNVCIKLRQIEEAIFFANGQIYNEKFTKEQQNKIRELIVSMKEIHKKQQAFRMLRKGLRADEVEKYTKLPNYTIKQMKEQLLKQGKPKPTTYTQGR